MIELLLCCKAVTSLSLSSTLKSPCHSNICQHVHVQQKYSLLYYTYTSQSSLELCGLKSNVFSGRILSTITS